ncbi:MAG: outer membrane protein assembly factor BamD [Nitrospirae bacterium]|nr:outer membrane protein assembly factor BamD [Nitrospirota bacterium]
MKRAFTCLLLPLLCAACASFHDPDSDRLRGAMEITVTPAKMGENPPEVSYSAEVIMSRAEGYFGEKQFAEAAQEYGRFMELHATHEWAPYALYQQGVSLMLQVKTADREPALNRQALQAFDNLIVNYPQSAAVDDATRRRDQVRERLAEHELGVARFYLRTDRAQSALSRLDYLMQNYPGTAIAGAAWFEMGQALAATGDAAGAANAYRRFLEGNPDPKRAAKAHKALAGLETGG